MFKGVLFSILFVTLPLFAHPAAIIDNDSVADTPSLGFRLLDVRQALDGITFEKLSPYLTSELEGYFDVFIFVNTDAKGGSVGFTPGQTVSIINRNSKDVPVFSRGSSGVINGVANGTEVKKILVSTGNGFAGIKTFSGIFKIDVKRTAYAPVTNVEAPMSYISYLNFDYDVLDNGTVGQPTGVAFHGTPTFNHKFLGVQRASHGCVRMLPAEAKWLREFLINPDLRSDAIPVFKRFSPLPIPVTKDGVMEKEPGVRALVIIFNGMEPVLPVQSI